MTLVILVSVQASAASIVQVMEVPSDKALMRLHAEQPVFRVVLSLARATGSNNTRLVIIHPPPIASFGNISRYQHRGAKPARRSTPL